MAPITALAKETLQLIFAQINSTKQLAQCRLVCRRFNTIVEKAILNCPIVVKTEDQALSLLQHLSRCQQRGIKDFHWDLEPPNTTTPLVFKHLLPYILNSKTVSISGVVEGEEFHDLMDELVEQLAEKPKLIALPRPEEPNKKYYQRLTKYQSTLQSAYIFMEEHGDINKVYVSDIFKFPKLKSLVMHGDLLVMQNFLEHFASVESSMQLEELELRFSKIEELWADQDVMDYEWLELHVKQSDRMKTLTLHGDCPAIFVETLMFMYPKLESVTLDMRIRSFVSHGRLQNELDRILECIETVAHKELTITSPSGYLSKDLIYYLTSNGYSVNIPATQHLPDLCMLVGGLN